MSVQTVRHLPSPAPALRLLETPLAEPPYDDQLPGALHRLRTAPLPVVPAPLRLVPPLAEPDLGPGADLDSGEGGADGAWTRTRTPLDDLSPAQPFALALVQRLLEVLAGVRPLAQLQRDTTPELFARLERVVASRPRGAGTRPDRRAVRSVHVQARPEGVAEVCATVKRATPAGPRAAALALRLEGLDGRWCCTELLGL